MTKPVIIAAGGLVKNEAGELLMIYRRGKWDLPKGKMDEGEEIEACAIREVSEETGVTNLQLGKRIDIGYHEYFDNYLQQEVIKETHWYEMRASGGQELVPQTEEDITEIRWVSGKELQACLADSYPNIVEIVAKSGL
jgi:8-oxo-dGTP pyrophosphatase MutT (NUDIX family)